MVPALVAVPLVLVDVTVYLFGDALRAGLLTDVLSGPVGQLLRLVPPLAFLAGVLRTQLDQSAVSRLLVDFGRSPTLADMEDALSRTLHDNSIQLYGWSAGARTWVDDRGVVQTLPKPTESVGVTIVDSDGDPLAASIHDPAIRDEATLLSAATAALRLTLDNKRLLVSVGTQAAQAGNMPRGRVTFLYADIEGSTGLLAALGDDYTDLLLEERRLIRQIVRDHHGFEVDARADEFLAVFVSAAEAAAAALAIDRRLRTQAWPRGFEVRVRIGLHTGEPAWTNEGYVGLDVHRVARIGSAGHGGQVVVSGSTATTIANELPPDAYLSPLGLVQLRGLPQPDDLFQLSSTDLPSDFPSLRLGTERPNRGA